MTKGRKLFISKFPNYGRLIQSMTVHQFKVISNVVDPYEDLITYMDYRGIEVRHKGQIETGPSQYWF